MDPFPAFFATLADFVSVPLLAFGTAALLAAAGVVLAGARRKRRQCELRTRIALLASQVTTLALQVARQGPEVRTTLLSLRKSLGDEHGAKLLDEEQLLHSLLLRARVLTSAVHELTRAEAVNGLTTDELKQRLHTLKLDAQRMKGIWDTLEATAWTLQSSEQALKRAPQVRPQPALARRRSAQGT
jgi:hypothetical protein